MAGPHEAALPLPPREVLCTHALNPNVLWQAREELAPPDVPRKYEHKEALVGLCRCGVGGGLGGERRVHICMLR